MGIQETAMPTAGYAYAHWNLRHSTSLSSTLSDRLRQMLAYALPILTRLYFLG
ncbi:hypothetical protein [Nostoc sp.]